MAPSSAPTSDYGKHLAGQDEPSSSDPVDSAARHHGFGKLGSGFAVAREREDAWQGGHRPRPSRAVDQSGRGC